MKTLIATIMFLLSSNVAAIPIAYKITVKHMQSVIDEHRPKLGHRWPMQRVTTIPTGWVVVGYQKQVSRYWTWHGRDSKTTMVPIYAPMTPVPEPETYILVLAGIGLVGWRVTRKNAYVAR